MSDRILIGTRKGVFVIDRNPAGVWAVARAMFLADNVSIVAADPRDGAWYTAMDHGHFGCKLHRSDDAGGAWTEVSPPVYPEPPPGAEPDLNPMTQKPIPWKLELIWALAAGGRDRPGELWCGTIPGGLFQSADRGQTWTMARSLWDHPLRKQWFGGGKDQPGIHSICVDPRDSRRVTVGVSCGGVWQTADGGTSWECLARGMYAEFMPPEQRENPAIQDAHCVVQCAGQPEKFWTQHHNGVFRSVDGCRNWTDVTAARPSKFGFAVAVHPADGDTAWFVPAIKDEHRIPVDGRVVVSRTRDGGRSFEVLSRGLPGPHAYDLVYRHALDVDTAGRRLAFGSTTGSLWVSEDQGDSWQTVSTHLPPVHCVRFVK